MKVIRSMPKQEFQVVITLSEVEARALDALVGYGDKAFIDSFLATFYEKMGKAYMKPNEDGLRELFKTVREEIPQHLLRFDKARRVFTDPDILTTPLKD